MTAADHGTLPPAFLIIIGAPKCGTTALAEAAAAHPDVLLSRPKEPHFFDCGFEKGLQSYLRDHFSGWQPRRVPCDATPSYLALPWVPRRIAETLPDARFVAILRHPVERAYSSWWMFHARGMDHLPFEEAIAANERRLVLAPIIDDEPSRQEWALHVEALARGDAIRIRTYLDSGHYARQLRRYLEVFPREQLLVVFSDDLRRDGAATMRQVWKHIGVADGAHVSKVGSANEALGYGAMKLLRLAQSTGMMRLRHILPESMRSSVKRRLSDPGSLPSMQQATRSRLVEHFFPHVCELEELLMVDLSAWKR